MNFQEVTALAVDITGRPDKVVQIRAAVNATISRLIMKKDRKSTRLNSSHSQQSRMPSSA